MFHIKHLQMPDERPAFTQMVEYESQPTINGYTLQVFIEQKQASIINLKKGGYKSMLKTVVKALEGFEKQFDELNEMKANLEADKEIAKQEALAKVDEQFAEKSERIDKVLETVSVVEEIEVEDEEVTEELVSQEPVEETVSDGTIAF